MSGKPYFNGWFIVHRNIYDDPAFRSTKKASEIEAYIWLVAQAAFNSCVINVDGNPVHLKRGQLCYAQRFLAKMWGWSDSATHRFLKRMVKWKKIEMQTETGQTLITICNYEEMQRPYILDETQMTQEGNCLETNKNKSNQLKQGIKDPSCSPPFKIDHHLSDKARAEISSVAPGWDKFELMSRFDEQVNNGVFTKPKDPNEAFLGFCRSFTKGKPPA